MACLGAYEERQLGLGPLKWHSMQVEPWRVHKVFLVRLKYSLDTHFFGGDLGVELHAFQGGTVPLSYIPDP